MSKLNQISSRNIIQGSNIDFNRDIRTSDEINDRMSKRNIPDSTLQPNFDPRPILTKYSLFPIIDRCKEVTVMKNKYDTYTPSSNFNPGDSAPVNGFINNVCIES